MGHETMVLHSLTHGTDYLISIIRQFKIVLSRDYGVKQAVKRPTLRLELATTRILWVGSRARSGVVWGHPTAPKSSTSDLEQQSFQPFLLFSWSPINNSNDGLLLHFHSHRPSSYNLCRQRQIRESAQPSSLPSHLNCY